ncbi:Cytosolic carboxypeptidase 1 [Dinochytrium kinnereticum]|nr:Cytosolic carboxypeptidase 1 [Dinochytrium kinnereticum]
MVATVGSKNTWSTPSPPQSGKQGLGSTSGIARTVKAKGKGSKPLKLKKGVASNAKTGGLASTPTQTANGSLGAAKGESPVMRSKKTTADTGRSRRGSESVRDGGSGRSATGGLLPRIKLREFGSLSSQFSSTLSMTASSLSQRALENLAILLSDPALTAYAKSLTPPVMDEPAAASISLNSFSLSPLNPVNNPRPLTPSGQSQQQVHGVSNSVPATLPFNTMQSYYVNGAASSSPGGSIVIPGPTSSLITTTSAPNSRRPSVKATPPPIPRHFSEPSLFPSNLNAPQILPGSLVVQPQPERDLRRRIIKQCLEVKRHVDKEGAYLSSDSPLYKTLFSRTPGACGVGVLLKCLRILHDVDVSIIVTNLILRMAGTNESNQHGLSFLARRNAVTSILRNLQGVASHISPGTPPMVPLAKSDSSSSFSTTGGKEGAGDVVTKCVSVAGPSPTALANSRVDELLSNILTLVCKLAKHDTKLPLIARLHGAVESIVDVLRRWHERRDGNGVLLALQAMKVFCHKAEVNVSAMHKKGVLDVLAGVLKGTPLSSIKETSHIEALLDLLTVFSRNEIVLRDILKLFGTRFFVSLFSSASHCESLQRCCLKLLRAIVETDEGRRAFALTDGIDVLTSSLELMALQSECSLTLQNTTAINSIPSLLISVLRAAVSETDLPHLDLIRHRISPLESYLVSYTDVSVRTTPSNDHSPPQVTPLRSRLRNRRPYSGIGQINTPLHPFLIPSSPSQISTPPPSASSLNYPLCLTRDEPQDEEVEASHLRSLCPEFEISERGGPEPSRFVGRSHRAVSPTDILLAGANLNVARAMEPIKPSPTAAGVLPPSSIAATSLQQSTASMANEPALQIQSSGSNSSLPPSASPLAATSAPANVSENPPELEPLQRRSTNAIRRTVFEQTTRILKPGMFTDIVVYDVMDESVATEAIESDSSVLLFESRFESGNLQLAIKASETEYDLILQTDIGSAPGKHNQWFYFSVANMAINQPYKFNIINMSKAHSQFSEGMQPVIYSMHEKLYNRFHRNHYRKPRTPPKRNGTPPSTNSAGRLGSTCSTYSTLSFSLTVSTPQDVIYVAYHYPYTLSDLSRFLNSLQFRDSESRDFGDLPIISPSNSPKFDDRCRRQVLCLSEGGNEVDLLTVTAFDKESAISHPVSGRVYIFLSSRVHPGESNSNYIMQGLIRFLMGDDDVAQALRKCCVFKIVPMLNPDGVINGSHRCGLAGTDLNREWRNPCKRRSPTIYWTKQLWKFLVDGGQRPLIACDFHGHSRKKNVFIFGCENVSGHAEGLEKIFPSLMASVNPIFDTSSCKYSVERSKEATARVVLWREMGVVGSYTLESTYCGADFGEKKGQQIQIQDLERVGADFCCAILSAIHIFDGKVPVASASTSTKKESRQDSKDSSSSGEEK